MKEKLLTLRLWIFLAASAVTGYIHYRGVNLSHKHGSEKIAFYETSPEVLKKIKIITLDRSSGNCRFPTLSELDSSKHHFIFDEGKFAPNIQWEKIQCISLIYDGRYCHIPLFNSEDIIRYGVLIKIREFGEEPFGWVKRMDQNQFVTQSPFPLDPFRNL